MARFYKRRQLLIAFIVFGLFSLSGKAWSDDARIFSKLKPDENLIFFRTDAWFDYSAQVWNVPIHAWVYEPQHSVFRQVLVETFFKEHFGLLVDDSNRRFFEERMELIISDNERSKVIVINFCGKNFTLPQSAEDGHAEITLKISQAFMEKCQEDGLFSGNNIVQFYAVTSPQESRTFSGEVRLLGNDGVSIISDIDDTVKISNVTDHKKLLESTFLLPFAAVPGMSKSYQNATQNQVSLHFVSSSPWYLYSPLLGFFEGEYFPWSSLSLKSFRFRDLTFFNLFKSGLVTKPEQIRPLLDHYPQRKFILIGDSGEQDPEVYGALLNGYSTQIAGIAIRNVTGENPKDDRYRSNQEDNKKVAFLLFSEVKELDLFLQKLTRPSN